MPELLIQPLIFGSRMTFIGLAPGACYGMEPNDRNRRRHAMNTLYVASAVTSAAHIIIQTEDSGQNGG